MNDTQRTVDVEGLKKILSGNQPETAILNAIRGWKELILTLATMPAPEALYTLPRVKAPAKVPAKENGHKMQHAPFNIAPGAKVKSPRPGTKRETLVKMLGGKGATIEQVCRKIGWDERLAYSNIRAMDRLGYGIIEDERGVIRLIAPA